MPTHSTIMPFYRSWHETNQSLQDEPYGNIINDCGKFGGYDPNNSYGVITIKKFRLRDYRDTKCSVGSFEISFRQGFYVGGPATPAPHAGIKIIKAVIYDNNDTIYGSPITFNADPTGQYVHVLGAGGHTSNPNIQTNLVADTDANGWIDVYCYISSASSSPWTEIQFAFRSLQWRLGASPYWKFDFYGHLANLPWWVDGDTGPNDFYKYQCIKNTKGLIVDGCFASNNCTIFGNLGLVGPTTVAAGYTYPYTVTLTPQAGLPYTAKLNNQTVYLNTFNNGGGTTNYPHQYDGILGTVTETTPLTNLATFNVTFLTNGQVNMTIHTENGNRSIPVSKSVQINNPNATVLLQGSSTVLEGNSSTFVINTNFPSGTLYWTASPNGSTLSAADFTDNTLSGTIAISNYTATLVRTVKTDSITPETGENFKIDVRTGSITGTIIGSSASAFITDVAPTTTTTTTLPPTLTATPQTNAYLGGTVSNVKYSKNGGSWLAFKTPITFAASDTMSFQFTAGASGGYSPTLGEIVIDTPTQYTSTQSSSSSFVVTLPGFTASNSYTVKFNAQYAYL